ncbi:thioredoxin domain-containing protein, partial [Candidatus Woesearchaeota archaeon]|nr:thioredoxin domain-containing protein [Candidatus Woesearchaeota archaeon]
EGGFHRYSTQQDWGIPHYEKLLHDQAVLIRAYAHLLRIINDEKVKNVVDASINFVLSKLSSSDGGFYNSQDADKEEAYYGEADRSVLPQPFIDKLQRVDANCLMASTLLYLYSVENNAEHKIRAEKCLNFIRQKMLSDNGAFFYVDDNKSFLTGFSLANAHVLLTFIDAFETLKNEEYIAAAKNIADFSLKNLAGENGGFFDRKSAEIELYPPNEENDFEKSYSENALFAYAFARLYKITKEKIYHDTALKTIGCLLELSPQSLDDVTYLLKAVKLLENN